MALKVVCSSLWRSKIDANYSFCLFWILCAASRSDVKLHHETKAVNLDRCNRIYAAANITVDSKHICAGGEDKDDTCTGDSGNLENFQIIP